MKIELYIDGYKFLGPYNNFSETILNRITATIKQRKYQKLHRTKANELKIITDVCLKEELACIIQNHLTLDSDFALRLVSHDILNSQCLKPTTEIGKVRKELTVDYYQLVLTYRKWQETDSLKLYFEVVESGDGIDYIINTLSLKE
jgi:hypothetical protein